MRDNLADHFPDQNPESAHTRPEGGREPCGWRPFAAISVIENDPDTVHGRQHPQLLARAVGRTIVDDNDFLLDRRSEDCA